MPFYIHVSLSRIINVTETSIYLSRYLFQFGSVSLYSVYFSFTFCSYAV